VHIRRALRIMKLTVVMFSVVIVVPILLFVAFLLGVFPISYLR
jgi:hypothetical protein